MRARVRCSLAFAVATIASLGSCASRPTAGPTSQAAQLRPAKPHTDDPRAVIFDRMWAFVAAGYCFFSDKRTDWNRVAEIYRPRALAAKDESELIRVLEDALDELYDPHTHLTTNLPSSWRLVPHDIWADLRDGVAVISVVRRGSVADRAGVRAGMVVVAIDGQPVEDAIAARRPDALREPDPEADGWALRSVLAGRHDRDRALELRNRAGAAVSFVLRAEDERQLDREVSSRPLSKRVGYIRIPDLGDPAAVEAVDRALEQFHDAAGLVFDVRDNPGGDTAVARPIMGRFIAERRPYAQMTRRSGEGLGGRWTEYVEPRGPSTYEGQVVVVVDRFSASMAEGFAMGMQGLGRARIVGTPMSGLGAATARVELPGTGFSAQISAQPVYRVDGRPRWTLVPDVVIDLATAEGDDPILDAAVALLSKPAARPK